jgi:hypothetical protein
MEAQRTFPTTDQPMMLQGDRCWLDSKKAFFLVREKYNCLQGNKYNY